MKLPKMSLPDLNVVKSYFYPVFWGTTDGESVANSIKEVAAKVAPGVHFADNFLTWGRNNSMFEDDEFVAAWHNNAETDADRAIVWRRYILACAVLDYLGGREFPKTFWGYDLFEHEAGMAHHSMEEHGPELYAKVQAKFADYGNVRLVKGMIPDAFVDNSPRKIAYLHIDLNEAPAEIAALDHLFDRVVPGGMIILDDYEWAGVYRPQKLSEDPWFDARGYRVMPLPTGQGLVFKR